MATKESGWKKTLSDVSAILGSALAGAGIVFVFTREDQSNKNQTGTLEPTHTVVPSSPSTSVPTETATPIPTETSRLTPTSTSTPTPTPTETTVPATNTLTPTSTFTDTPRPSPTLTPTFTLEATAAETERINKFLGELKIAIDKDESFSLNSSRLPITDIQKFLENSKKFADLYKVYPDLMKKYVPLYVMLMEPLDENKRGAEGDSIHLGLNNPNLNPRDMDTLRMGLGANGANFEAMVEMSNTFNQALIYDRQKAKISIDLANMPNFFVRGTDTDKYERAMLFPRSVEETQAGYIALYRELIKKVIGDNSGLSEAQIIGVATQLMRMSIGREMQPLTNHRVRVIHEGKVITSVLQEPLETCRVQFNEDANDNANESLGDRQDQLIQMIRVVIEQLASEVPYEKIAAKFDWQIVVVADIEKIKEELEGKNVTSTLLVEVIAKHIAARTLVGATKTYVGVPLTYEVGGNVQAKNPVLEVILSNCGPGAGVRPVEGGVIVATPTGEVFIPTPTRIIGTLPVPNPIQPTVTQEYDQPTLVPTAPSTPVSTEVPSVVPPTPTPWSVSPTPVAQEPIIRVESVKPREAMKVLKPITAEQKIEFAAATKFRLALNVVFGEFEARIRT